jgi:hypothetical protein
VLEIALALWQGLVHGYDTKPKRRLFDTLKRLPGGLGRTVHPGGHPKTTSEREVHVHFHRRAPPADYQRLRDHGFTGERPLVEPPHLAHERIEPTENRAVLGEFGRVEIQAR